jgi:HJR/Mrr/RecB family endonuclease
VALGSALGVVLLAQMIGLPLLARVLAGLVALIGVLALFGRLPSVVMKLWRLRRTRPPAPRRADALLQMAPGEFELHVADLFARAGYRVEHAGGSGDGGVDIRVWRGGEYGVVQCKHYRPTNPVGPAAVRELVGTRLHERADTAWLVTTGRLTKGGHQLAGVQRIHLLDVEALVRWEASLLRRAPQPALAG